MDWYSVTDAKNLVFPHHEDTSDFYQYGDQSPYSNVFFKWEAGKTRNMTVESSTTGLNSNQQDLYESMDIQSSINDVEGSSYPSANGDFSFVDVCGRILEPSFYDETLEELWESTFIIDSSTLNGLPNSCDPACKSVPFGNLLTNLLIEPQCSPNVTPTMGCAIVEPSICPLIKELVEDEEQLDNVSSSLMNETSNSLDGSPTASLLSVLVSEEKMTSAAVGHVQEKYFEKIVLQELEDVMSQLNMETRICFRDALYRLAKTSEKHHSCIETRPASNILGENDSSQDREKPAESKTNAIDRIVANLMFSKPNSDVQDFSCQGSMHQYVESSQISRTCDNCR